MDSLSPNLFVKNMNETIKFYSSIGFQTIMSVPPGGDNFDWAMMANGEVIFMFQTFASLGDELPAISRQNGGSLLFYIKLKNIRNFFEQVKNKVTVLKGIEKTFYGATEFSILDNNNYVLTFAEDEE